jgi:ubiquinone/menaquinone biosynthesis C-methylase UbiE
MLGSLPHHLAELGIVRQLEDPRRAVPTFPCDGWVVLDVGCGIGQTLSAVEFANCAGRHGIDPDAEAIAYGRDNLPGLILEVGRAEAIPYPDGFFDLAYSRVALPYSNVPQALAELFRVTKGGGVVWLALHPWKMERRHWVDALRRRDVRRIVDRAYVLIHSAALFFLQYSFGRPWSGSYESFQLPSGIRRLLAKTGFVDIEISMHRHFVVRARKPS